MLRPTPGIHRQEMACSLSERIDKEANSTEAETWVRTAYRLALGREPDDKERIAMVFFSNSKRTPKPPANRPVYWEYGLAKWDVDKKTLSGFEPLTEFTQDS